MNQTESNFAVRMIERFLFGSRWLLVFLYTFLNLGLLLYTFKFAEELWHMLSHIQHLTTELAMLSLLSLVDITMVANLVVMVNIGGYSIFIREIDAKRIQNRPRFMNNITSSGLKVKMGSSLVGVSSIHLLKIFIQAASNEVANLSWYYVAMAIVIHIVFVFSTMALSYVDVSSHKEKDSAHA